MVNKRPAGERAAFALRMACGHALGVSSAIADIKNSVNPDPSPGGYQPAATSEKPSDPPNAE